MTEIVVTETARAGTVGTETVGPEAEIVVENGGKGGLGLETRCPDPVTLETDVTEDGAAAEKGPVDLVAPVAETASDHHQDAREGLAQEPQIFR